MTLVHTTRAAGRTGRPQFVPGSLACAATARPVLLARTPFALSSSLKRVSGAFASPVHRLAPVAV